MPRPLVFINLPKGAKFIPMAAEFADRHTIAFFDKFRDSDGRGSPDTLHIHIEAAGKHNTGTFGYRPIRRALGHGMRIVGTLRDGPDVHVLTP